MKYKLLAFLTAFILLALCPLCAFADTVRVYDGEGLFNGDEEERLTDKLEEISARYGVDLVVVTAASFDGKTAEAFADDWYDYHGYKEDGMLLLISAGGRRWHVSTCGVCIDAFGDDELDDLENRLTQSLKKGDYYGASLAFAEKCDRYIGAEVNFKLWPSLLISLAIGLVVALAVTMTMRSKLKTVRRQAAASQYIRQGSLKISAARDFFLYSSVARTAKPKEGSGGSGRGVHTSSSGRSHGGRGGGF